MMPLTHEQRVKHLEELLAKEKASDVLLKKHMKRLKRMKDLRCPKCGSFEVRNVGLEDEPIHRCEQCDAFVS